MNALIQTTVQQSFQSKFKNGCAGAVQLSFSSVHAGSRHDIVDAPASICLFFSLLYLGQDTKIHPWYEKTTIGTHIPF